MSRASRNFLDIKKTHALTNWLTENIQHLRELTIPRVADLATDALGFAVTKANIVHVRDGFDLDLGRHQQTPPDHAQIVEDLRTKVSELSHQVHIMAGLVRRLLEEHGETEIPPGLNGVSSMPRQLSL